MNGEYYSIKQLEKSKTKLEEKLKRLNDQSRKDNIVTFEQLGCDRIFIDEAHLLVSRSTSNLNVDFANMLKPGLDRGTIKMIGATTTEEYDSYILRDRAFLRRFQKVDVCEPSIDDTVNILMGTYPKLEKQSGVLIPYSEYQKQKIFRFITEFTDEYKRIYEIGNRYPDIALTLLGNAFSNAVFENTNELRIRHIYEALKNSKNVYPDAKRKSLVEFKDKFSDIIEEENLVMD